MSDGDANEGVLMTEETDVTEITIQPDGRIYVFGASLGVLEALDAINPHDARVRAVLAQLRRLEAQSEQDKACPSVSRDAQRSASGSAPRRVVANREGGPALLGDVQHSNGSNV